MVLVQMILRHPVRHAPSGRSMISSDMEELLGMSDRITVLYEKQLSGDLPADHMAQEYILEMASGNPHGLDA